MNMTDLFKDLKEYDLGTILVPNTYIQLDCVTIKDIKERIANKYPESAHFINGVREYAFLCYLVAKHGVSFQKETEYYVVCGGN